jgi:DNA repair ATPase RecN
LIRTRNQLNALLTIPQKVADIQALLEDDINLLEVHREMRQLEKARDFVLKQAEKFPEQQRQLKELFYNVNLLSDEFETHIWELVADHIRLAMVRYFLFSVSSK